MSLNYKEKSWFTGQDTVHPEVTTHRQKGKRVTNNKHVFIFSVRVLHLQPIKTLATIDHKYSRIALLKNCLGQNMIQQTTTNKFDSKS